MGMGRQSKPTKLKELSDNPGKRKLNKAEPKPYGLPTAPTTLSKDAKAVWARLVVAMPVGVYTAADGFVMALFCEAVASWKTACAMIAKHGPELKGSTGQLKPSPWYAEQRAAAAQIASIGAKLGLDPVSRQNIITEGADGGNDGFGDLIN